MRKVYFVILLTFFISACGINSGSGTSSISNNPNNNKPDPNKHIEPGTNLIFMCLDTFNETTMTLISIWYSNAPLWDISGSENDRNGNRISVINDFTGEADKIQDHVMIVKNGVNPYAKIVQNGTNHAMLYGRGRNMQCTFN